MRIVRSRRARHISERCRRERDGSDRGVHWLRIEGESSRSRDLGDNSQRFLEVTLNRAQHSYVHVAERVVRRDTSIPASINRKVLRSAQSGIGGYGGRYGRRHLATRLKAIHGA